MHAGPNTKLVLVERYEARRPHTCSRPCAKKKKTGTKNTKRPVPPKTLHEIHSSPAIATASRRRATKHVPRVSPCSPASIDPGFLEIGLVQLSQNDECCTYTQTGKQTD